MRIGLIGAGRIGAFHAATLRGLPGVGSVVIADADAARAGAVASRLGAELADSAHDLLAAGLDALVIATATDRFHDACVAELAAFLDVVRGDVPSPCPPRDALAAFYVAEACELSRHRCERVDMIEVCR